MFFISHRHQQTANRQQEHARLLQLITKKSTFFQGKPVGSFVENSLITGEKIEQKATISWLSQFWLFVWSLILCFTIIAPIVFILIAIVNVVTTELAVTNKKVIGKAGFIRRESIDLPLTKLESINIDQGIIGRILGFGRVSIRGIGGNNVSIPFIKDPMSFRRVVMNLMDQKSSNEITS